MEAAKRCGLSPRLRGNRFAFILLSMCETTVYPRAYGGTGFC